MNRRKNVQKIRTTAPKRVTCMCDHTLTQRRGCPMKESIHYSEEISNNLKEKNLYKTLSAYAVEYIIAILISIFSAGYCGKTVDMEKHSSRHRTNISRFLSSEAWGITADWKQR